MLFLFVFALLFNCTQNVPKDQNVTANNSPTYFNHSDSAKYVGMNTCRQCHQNIYNTFIKTGMGKSFDVASSSKSSGNFAHAFVYDKLKDFHYHAFWKDDSLFMKEFRLNKRDTIHQRVEQVNYIIGSGQHTNSHMQLVNGYLTQMPMTFYSQKKKWDLPPGFENGYNTRFSRKIGLECMSCHNAYPQFEMGSENKFRSLPQGIDCERCHGPGSYHVAERQTGERVDTSKFIDYSIVNPGKLPIDLQFDVCQRCHLQGNAILKEGKSFYDFKPGQKLSDYISVFLPKYKNAEDEFIMASHADRLKQSACFIKSFEKADANSLRPYKKAMTCVTCHNPHISVRETNKNVFNEACLNCHANKQQLEEDHRSLKNKNWLDCVSCHMPVSGSTDIPHVTVHDHFIRKSITKEEKEKIKTFVGLFSVNEKNPDPITKAKAWIDQYDKFEQNAAYLDSAQALLDGIKDLKRKLHALVQLKFIRQDFNGIIAMVNELGEKNCLEQILTKKSWDNLHAWTTYRTAEAYNNTGDAVRALTWFQHSVKLAPYNLDYRNKLATVLAANNKMDEAITEYQFILRENPQFVAAYSNLGYIRLIQGAEAEALRLYQIGEGLDPDNESLLLNLAAYFLFKKENKKAQVYLQRILKINPHNKKAKNALAKL